MDSTTCKSWRMPLKKFLVPSHECLATGLSCFRDQKLPLRLLLRMIPPHLLLQTIMVKGKDKVIPALFCPKFSSTDVDVGYLLGRPSDIKQEPLVWQA